MATVTITEILGGDNIAASRIVINNNFSLLQNAVNTLETRLNTSYVPGGSLNVGDAQVLKYSRPITQNIFLVQASAQIDGNLSLGTPTNNSTLAITGFVTVSQDLTVADDVAFTNVGSNNNFNNSLPTITDDAEADLQMYTTSAKNPVFLSQSAAILPITLATRVLWIDLAAYTGVVPFNIAAWSLPSVASPTVRLGQKIIIRFVPNTHAGPNYVQFSLNNATNFDTAFNFTSVSSPAGSNIILNATLQGNPALATNLGFFGIWIELVAAVSGWRVIGAHGDVTYF